MNTEPIHCIGDELSGVLASIRARGGTVEAMDAMVGGNAGWLVHYFERVDEPDGIEVQQ